MRLTIRFVGLALVGCLSSSGAFAAPSEIEPFPTADRTTAMPLAAEPSQEHPSLPAEISTALAAAAAEREALRRDLVRVRLQAQSFRFEAETARYEQAMQLRLFGSIAILVVGILVSLILGLWQSVRQLRFPPPARNVR